MSKLSPNRFDYEKELAELNAYLSRCRQLLLNLNRLRVFALRIRRRKLTSFGVVYCIDRFASIVRNDMEYKKALLENYRQYFEIRKSCVDAEGNITAQQAAEVLRLSDERNRLSAENADHRSTIEGMIRGEKLAEKLVMWERKWAK